ncbi:MAG: hypothetical protein K6E30_01350 [Lachnospiraceae bacterium]|nr:hypothetical protein [Lachnospiraceae bacterium]
MELPYASAHKTALKRIRFLLDIVFCLDFMLIYSRILINNSFLDPRYSNLLPAGQMEILFNVLVNLTLILAALNLIVQAKITPASILAAAALILSVIVRLTIGYWSLSYLALSLLSASYGRSAKKILVTAFLVSVLLTILIFFLSQTGYIAYTVSEQGKHSFGFNYHTDAAARILYTLSILFVLKNGLLNHFDYLLLLLFIIFNWLFMGAKTVLLISLLLLAGTACYQSFLVPGMRKKRKSERITFPSILIIALKSFLSAALILAVPAFSAVSYVLTSEYTEDPAMFYNRYSFLSTIKSRLMIGRKALSEYRISLFGQSVPQEGFGGLSKPEGSGYFYIDNSYIRILVMYGIVIFLFVMLLFVILSARALLSRNFYLLFILTLIAFESMIDQFLLNPFYNTFLILVLADLDLPLLRFKISPDESPVGAALPPADT